MEANSVCDARPVIAFFSRGRGNGHAVPDMALVDELIESDKNIDVRWIAYGTGADTIRARGHRVIDLCLPDENPFLETELRATRVLGQLRPSLVVSHEEFAALPAAKLFGLPTLCITDYFLDYRHIWMQCLVYADEIIFIDAAGVFEEPPSLRGKTYYTGPFVRHFTYTRRDRNLARAELGLPLDATILLVLPGGWFTESRAPILDLVLAAYRSLPFEKTHLVWFAGHDYNMLADMEQAVPSLIVKNPDSRIDRWMVACDLAITKGTRKTSIELESLGIPSISLSHGLNPIDDKRVSKIQTNRHVNVADVDASTLCSLIQEVLISPEQPVANTVYPGLTIAAERLRHHIDRIRNQPNVNIVDPK